MAPRPTDNGKGSSSDEEDFREKRVKLQNPNLEKMSEDVLHHFALGTKSHDLPNMFGDVKFVVVGGSQRRMETFANFMIQELKFNLPAGQMIHNIADSTDSFALYKVGPVLMASHGMGIPSIAIMMNEVIKITHHSRCSGVTFFRMGTCGGLGLVPGTAVVSESAVDGLLRPYMQMRILDKVVERPAILDEDLAKEVLACSQREDKFQTILGTTMCTNDFYEEQGRLDGAFCEYTEEDKMEFLHQCYASGIRNIEMESLCFAAMCHKAGIRGAVVCVTLLDRLKGDQIDTPRELMDEWVQRPAILLARWIKKQLGIEESTLVYSRNSKFFI